MQARILSSHNDVRRQHNEPHPFTRKVLFKQDKKCAEDIAIHLKLYMHPWVFKHFIMYKNVRYLKWDGLLRKCLSIFMKILFSNIFNKLNKKWFLKYQADLTGLCKP